MPSQITQQAVNELGAGPELDERVSFALEAFWWLSQPWPPSNAVDRLRRLLGLPSPHPVLGDPQTQYAGVAWSSLPDTDALQTACQALGVAAPDSEVVPLCRWIVTQAMDEVDLD